MSTTTLDFSAETALSLVEAARMLPRGRFNAHVHPATLTRWILRGCRTAAGDRVRLRAGRVGCRWVTSREALEDFLAALSPAADPTGPQTAAPTGRQSRRSAGSGGRKKKRLTGLTAQVGFFRPRPVRCRLTGQVPPPFR
jgi:hypothetical protein